MKIKLKKKKILILIGIISILLIIFFYRFETRKFLNLSVNDLLIEDATEDDFVNSPVRNKNYEDYFNIFLSIGIENTSRNLSVKHISINITFLNNIDENNYIDIGLVPLSDDELEISPKSSSSLPYKIFVKKKNYSKEELLKILKKVKLKANFSSMENSFLSWGYSKEFF